MDGPLIFEQVFQGCRNRYNIIDRPSASCIFCEKNQKIFEIFSSIHLTIPNKLKLVPGAVQW
jgi:hypothetical protein